MGHRWTRLATLAVMAALLALPAAATADATTTTEPTVTLVRDCEIFADANSVDVILTGFPPFTAFNGFLQAPGGSAVGPVEDLTTDENGYWNSHDLAHLGIHAAGVWSVTITWEGGTLTDSLYVDCSEPASKNDCKNGEWRRYDRFGFKSQGECVAFVQRAP